MLIARFMYSPIDVIALTGILNIIYVIYAIYVYKFFT